MGTPACRDATDFNSTFGACSPRWCTEAVSEAETEKKPITVDMLSAWVRGSSSPFIDTCLCAMALLHRFKCSVMISPIFVAVTVFSPRACWRRYICKSKTDQYRGKVEVLVARTSSPTCPVGMKEQCYALASLEHT